MKSRWTEYKGKRVFLADYSHFGADTAALKQEADDVVVFLEREALGSVRSISNVEGTAATVGNIQVLMNILPHTNRVVRKRCVIGATGMRWEFVQTFNRLAGRAQFQTFHKLEEALDWITQD